MGEVYSSSLVVRKCASMLTRVAGKTAGERAKWVLTGLAGVASVVEAPPAPPTPAQKSTPEVPQPTGPDPRDTAQKIESLDQGLGTLAKALAQPQSYRSARAVLDDLAAYESERSRRDGLA